MTSEEQPGHDVPPKATLFCPGCDHRSRFDGDWTVARTARTVHYACPDCRTEINGPSDRPGTVRIPHGRVLEGVEERVPGVAAGLAPGGASRADRRVRRPASVAGSYGRS